MASFDFFKSGAVFICLRNVAVGCGLHEVSRLLFLVSAGEWRGGNLN